MGKRNSFAADAARLTGSKIIGNLLALVSGMLLARIRTLDENGTYSALILIVNLAASIFMLGLPNSINYFLSRAETITEKNKFLSFYYTFSSVISAILGVVLVAFIPMWVSYFNNESIRVFAFFLLFFPWEKVTTASVENVLVVLGKSTELVYYRISNSIMLLAIILIVWMTNASFTVYMILYVLIEGAYSIAIYVMAGKYTGRLYWNLNKKLIKKVLSFSIPLGLASIVGTLNIEIDKLMLGHLLNTSDLAIYTNASKELPLTMVATSLTAVLMPKMVQLFDKGKYEEAVEIWRDVTTISFAIMAYFSIGMASFSTEAMTILYSEKYAPGGSVFAVYSISLLLKCTYFGMILNSTGRTRMIFYSAVGSLALNVVLNAFLYRMLGTIGPAIATFLSGLTMALYQLFFSAKITGVSFVRIFPWKNILFLTLLNVILGIVFTFVHEVVLLGNWQAIVLAVIWGLAYAIILYKPAKRYLVKLRGV